MPDVLLGGTTYCHTRRSKNDGAAAGRAAAAAAAGGGGSAGPAKETARSSVAARASTQTRSINPAGGGPGKPARTSSPFNQQEWLDHHCGKQNRGSGEDVVRICGCGKSFGDGAGVNYEKKMVCSRCNANFRFIFANCLSC